LLDDDGIWVILILEENDFNAPFLVRALVCVKDLLILTIDTCDDYDNYYPRPIPIHIGQYKLYRGSTK